MPNARPPARQYVGFDDPDGSTWLFDVAFLTSSWTCIFGSGCKGVLTEDATDRGEGCCSYGAHFADRDDRVRVRRAAKRLTADQWQNRRAAGRAEGAFARQADGGWMTSLVDDACCFHNDDEFAGGAGCALHLGALLAGERPMDWKPTVCWLVPLRLVSEIDELGHRTSTLREWKRRDWGEGGEDFHWWCTESHEAFVGATRVYEALADEIIELVGAERYAWFVDHVSSTPRPTLLPHPAVRGRGERDGADDA